jgi:tetratricopeptide (TPR) repeat protein
MKQSKGFGKPPMPPAPRLSQVPKLFARAANLQQAGMLRDAERLYRQILQTQPDHQESLQNLGVLLCLLGAPAAGEVFLTQLVALQPDAAFSHYNLGVAQEARRKFGEAEASYRQALAIDPIFPQAHNNLGSVLFQQGQLNEAEGRFRKAIALEPDFADAHYNLGSVLVEIGQQENHIDPFQEAEIHLRKTLSLKSDSADAHYNLGNALLEIGQRQNDREKLVEADPCFRQALTLNPQLLKARCNLGLALAEIGHFDVAKVCYDQTLSLDPEEISTHNNRSHLLLLLGDFQEGWQSFDYHWQTQISRSFFQPLWDGSDLQGKTILLWAEFGFGDAIQFLRYAPLVKALGARVIVECRSVEVRLFETCPGIDQLIVQGELLPDFDAHLPLLGLPKIFQTDLSTIPATVPYFFPPASTQISEEIQEQLQTAPGLKVGLVWSPKLTLAIDYKRRCPLAEMRSLFELPEISWFSLYKGSQSEDLADFPQITDVGSYCEDFADTAWAISQLDLVITVDTSVAHLAGALGKTTWLLLPFVPDWRWLLGRSDSPWYPTARLFRQPNFGDWSSVITSVGIVLQERTGSMEAPEPLLVLASQYQQLGQLREAQTAYRQFLETQPNHVGALQSLGMILYQLDDPFSAEPLFRRALELQPDAVTHRSLGLVLESQNRSAEAEACCLEAIRLDPQSPEAYNALGNTQMSQGKLNEAEVSYRQAIALRADYGEAQCNLGNIYIELRQYSSALEAYQQALEVQPDLAYANANQAYPYLIQGDFENGWEKYEWRWHVGSLRPRPFEQPMWNGEDLNGKRIFVHAEQGFGDTFQFIRYLKLLQERGAIILMECRAPEYSLLQNYSELSQLLVRGEPLPDFDFHVPLLSLPKLFETTLQTIPAEIPYLYQPERCQLPEDLQETLKTVEGFKIGFVWTASTMRFTDRKRACPLALLGQLFELPGLTWFSLYKGELAGELEAFPDVIDLGSGFQDFTDTAWAISQLDLVITVDTSVAHLAGAMGKTTWVLLPFAPDWRWLVDREDSSWYPTMRLFRQPDFDNWKAVIENLGAALCERLEISEAVVIEAVQSSLSTVPEAFLEEQRAYHLAMQNQELGRLPEAINIYQKILQLKPDHSEALNNLGMLYHELGDLAAAEPLLCKAATLKPDNAYFRFNWGLLLLKQENFEQAEHACQQAVLINPNFAEALNTLGNIQASQGKLDQAESSYRRAIALRPDFAGTLNNLGNVMNEKGDFEAALLCYEQALAVKPDLEDALQNRARLMAKTNWQSLLQEAAALHDGGSYQEAEEIYRRVIEAKPDSPEAHSSLGSTLLKQRRVLEAEISQRQAIALKPDFASAHFHLGNTLSDQGRFVEAETSFRQASLLDPGFADAHYNLGTLLQWQSRLEEAKTNFQHAVQARPEFIEAYNNLGSVLLALGETEEAEQIFRQAVALDPHTFLTHNNLGTALFEQRRFEESVISFQQAIVCDATSAQVHNNLGATLVELGNLEAAEMSYSQALVLNPDYPEAHNNLALLCLLQGDFQRGWSEFEWRWRTEKMLGLIPVFVQPRWDGTSLKGKTILLWSEQGFGDVLQCIRLIPMVKALGARVLFNCYEPLTRLLAGFPGIDHLIPENATRSLPTFEVQLPLLSLPEVLKVTVKTIPNNIPYLTASEPLGLSESLKQKLQQPGFKVGLVWAPKMEDPLLRKRHCPLDKLAPLFDLESSFFFSLYKGSQIFELEPYTKRLIDIGSHCQDFADTAWAIAQLDLVITVDTAVAHLAGAMGKETWVLLPFAPDWRWLLDRADSPWYPTLRLFRQPNLENWEAVVMLVSHALQEKLEQ